MGSYPMRQRRLSPERFPSPTRKATFLTAPLQKIREVLLVSQAHFVTVTVRGTVMLYVPAVTVTLMVYVPGGVTGLPVPLQPEMPQKSVAAKRRLAAAHCRRGRTPHCRAI